ncbi:MAG: hypothetical protein KAH44_25845, partial [Oricola sp.]|nr:hypothetical protein [Oricola sp.]
ALLSLAILLAGKLYGRSLAHAGYTSSTQPYEVSIGSDVVAVAANLVRMNDQRHPGIANRLDLYIHWPTMSGFRDGLASAFNDIDPETNSIIFMSILPRATSADMAGRFDAVYRNVLAGPVTNAGYGLRKAPLSAEHGYIDEEIIFSAPDLRTGRRFVVRCQDDAATDHVVVAPCETDVHFGETLTAQIRFPRRLLSDWAKINAALPKFTNGLLATDRQ